MDIQNDWIELMQLAKEKSLLLHRRQSFCVFPETGSLSFEQVKLLTVRNLTAYQFRLIVEIYNPIPEDLPPEISTYLENITQVLCKNQAYNAIIKESKTISKADAKLISDVANSFPVIPQNIPDQIKAVDDIRKQAVTVLNKKTADPDYRSLYDLSVLWFKVLGTEKLQIIPVQKPFEYASYHLKLHESRACHHDDRSIEWGKEYDTYYRQFIREGCCEQTARAKARNRFMEAHPVPRTDAELLADVNPPGITRQTLHKYHQAYLKSRQEDETRDEH